MKIIKNEGTLDRLVRLVLSVVFLCAALLWFTGILQIIAYVLAAILLFTSVTGFCALYSLFGFRTTKDAV